MPQEKRARHGEAPATASHEQTCELHDDEDLTEFVCNGRKKDGARCSRSALSTSRSDGYLPTCKQHDNQNITASKCKAIASCGKQCLRPHGWLPLEFALCSAHLTSMPSMLLKLPIELRLDIFRLLLPLDDPHFVPEYGFRAIGHDRCMTLLLINRQISAEFLHLLYERTIYGVRITEYELQCAGRYWPALDRAWRPFPGSNDLSRIRSFRVQISVHKHWRENPDQEDESLHNLRRNVSKLADFLVHCNRVQNLTVNIAFPGFDWQSDELLAAIKFTLFPFKSLRGVVNARIGSVRWSLAAGDNELSWPRRPKTPMVTALSVTAEDISQIPGEQADPGEADFIAYKQEWEALLTGHSPVLVADPDFRLYNELDGFAQHLAVAQICDDKGDSRCNQYALLHSAYMAHTTRDTEIFDAIKESLVQAYREYQTKRQKLEYHFSDKFANLLGPQDDLTTRVEYSDRDAGPPVVRPVPWPQAPLLRSKSELADILDKSPHRRIYTLVDEEGTQVIEEGATSIIRYRTPAVVRELREEVTAATT